MKLIVDITKHLPAFTLSVSFSTKEGLTSLFGPSGSGKSLTLRAIAGISDPDEGYIELDGKVLFDSRKGISIPPERRNIGFLFQNYALFPTMNVWKNLYQGTSRIKEKREKIGRIEKMGNMLSISHLMEKYPFELSGGESQRVALGRMLLTDPDFLLFDEPFSALDDTLKGKIEEEFNETIKKSGKSGLMVTHSRKEALHLTSSIIFIKDGRVIGKGELPEVYKTPRTKEEAELFGYENIFRMDGYDVPMLRTTLKETGRYVLVKSFSVIPGNSYRVAFSTPEENGYHTVAYNSETNARVSFSSRKKREEGEMLSLSIDEYTILS